MAVTRHSDITLAELQTLAALANAKMPGGNFVFTSNNWLTELRRIRSYLSSYLSGRPEINAEISGPWPVLEFATGNGFNWRLTSVFGRAYPDGGPYYDTTVGLYRMVWFYGAATAAPTVTAVHAPGQVRSQPESQPSYPVNSMTCRLKIGGNVSVRFVGTLGFRCSRYSGSDALTANVVTDFPGASFHVSGNDYLSDFDTTLTPGIYNFTITTGAGWSVGTSLGVNQYLQAYQPGTYGPDAYGARIEAVVGGGVQVAGVHDSLPVWRVCCTPPASGGDTFGIYSWVDNYYTGSSGRWHLTTKPSFFASVAGLWVALTPPIKTLHNVVGYMPWNPLITSGAYQGDPLRNESVDPPIRPNEMQTQPIAGSERISPRDELLPIGIYTKGGGYYHVSTTVGVTGLQEPTWSTARGGITIDGSVSWRNIGNARPAVARSYCVPCWPVYKLGETDARKPQNMFANWGVFKTPGSVTGQRYWFIHRVRINRIFPRTAGSSTIDSDAESVSIPVRIGCIRNGSFESFGTFRTGQWLNIDPLDNPPNNADPVAGQVRVMWPIFVNDALVYDADEYVDVQAEICWFPALGYGVEFPILADHYNDTETLLQLL